MKRHMRQSIQFFKGCLPQILLSPFTLSHMMLLRNKIDLQVVDNLRDTKLEITLSFDVAMA